MSGSPRSRAFALAMLPAALAIGTASLGLSARLIGRFGERTILLAGLVLLLAARLLLTRLPVDATYALDLLPVMLVSGGIGLAMPALTAQALTGGYRLAFQAGAGLLGAALVLTVAVVRGRPVTTAPAQRPESDAGELPVAQAF